MERDSGSITTMRRFMLAVVVAFALLVSVAAPKTSAHATWYTHSHYVDSFCNSLTGAYYRIYDWQYASGAHIYYEWRFMWYGCGIA